MPRKAGQSLRGGSQLLDLCAHLLCSRGYARRAFGNPLRLPIGFQRRIRYPLQRTIGRGGELSANRNMSNAGVERLTSPFDASLHVADETADLLRRIARSIGELTHLVGDDRESATVLPCSSSLDCRVER